MQQACHAWADIGCEDFGWAHAQEVTENTGVFGSPHGRHGAWLLVPDSAREQARTTKVRRSRATALLWVSGALDQRVLAGSLTTARRCSVNRHAGATLLIRIACFFTKANIPPRPPRPENLNDSQSAAP